MRGRGVSRSGVVGVAVLGFGYPPRLASPDVGGIWGCLDEWMVVGRSSGWGSAGSLRWFATAWGFLRYQRWTLALSWARASAASVGVSWGSAMSSTGNRDLPGGFREWGASVGGCVSSRTSLCGGLEEVAGRCCSSSLSLDGRDLGFFVCGCG